MTWLAVAYLGSVLVAMPACVAKAASLVGEKDEHPALTVAVGLAASLVWPALLAEAVVRITGEALCRFWRKRL